MEYRFCLGTYTSKLGHVDGSGPGIMTCVVSAETGEIWTEGEPIHIVNPSYLWSNRAGNRLYATSEMCVFQGKKDGSISVLSLEPNCELKLLQQVGSAGMGPAYCRGTLTEETLMLANYVAGNIAFFELAENGEITSLNCSVAHFGSGPVQTRQEAPHPHAIMMEPNFNTVLVADLGIDKLKAYRLEDNPTRPVPLQSHDVLLPAGSGPRHMCMHPHLPIMYVALELSSEIGVVDFTEEVGKLVAINDSFQKDKNKSDNSHPSELIVSYCGTHLYIANREVDLISLFTIDATGNLSWQADFPCGGKTPRHIALTPDESILLVANQDSNELASFWREQNTGLLKPTGRKLEIGTPCFIDFPDQSREEK